MTTPAPPPSGALFHRRFHRKLHHLRGRYRANRDLDEITHAGGVSPAWPLKYRDFAPYYDAAEALFQVHGARGEDPTEPPAATPYPHRAVKREPKVAQLSDKLKGIGLKPFHLPLGILLDQKEDGFNADQHLHPLHRVRWLPLPPQWQGRRAGDLHCPDAGQHDNA